MATSTYLSNPKITVNSVDLSDQGTACTFTRNYDQLETTAFGSTSRTYTGGLVDHEISITLYMSYAASETYASLSALVGTTTTVTVNPSTGANSATNPAFTLTGAFMPSLPVINATLGELSTIDVTFVGGTYSAVTA